jgi:hypothetical protein
VLHDLPDIALALIVLGAFVLAWRAEGDDPIWGNAGAPSPPPTEPASPPRPAPGTPRIREEIELAAGYARRTRRRNRPYALIYAIRVPLGIALLAGGLIADSVLFIAFGVIFLLGGAWALIKGRQESGALRETISRDHTRRSD